VEESPEQQVADEQVQGDQEHEKDDDLSRSDQLLAGGPVDLLHLAVGGDEEVGEGRQVDRAIGALSALPGVVAAVAGQAPVLFDSGIRTGADAAIALALGADAVLVGRPFAFGLALGGQSGVHHVLCCLLAELDTTLALAGYRDLAELHAAEQVVAGAP